MTALFQFAAVLALAACLFCWRMRMCRRNAQSWNSLVARLKTDGNARELLDPKTGETRLNATLLERGERIRSARGLWSIFANAGVMFEMADFAARHSESFASVESVKAASDVYAPLSGKVIETNAKLADDPALVNTGAESVGWFVKLEVADASEASALMGDAAYKAHCDAAAAEKH